jgi:hypothetical protein
MLSREEDPAAADRRRVDVADQITAWVSKQRLIDNLRHFTTAECSCSYAERVHAWHNYGDHAYNVFLFLFLQWHNTLLKLSLAP